MKQYFLVVLGIFSFIILEAQPKFGGANRDRFITELTWNTWTDMPDSLKTRPVSRGFNTFLMWDFPISDMNVSFAPGIGISTSSIFTEYFVGTERIDSATMGNTIFPLIPDSLNYKKHKVTLASFDVPMEFRFRTNPDKNNKRWKLGVGVLGGFVFNSHTKYIGDDPAYPNEDIKVKNFDLPNITKFRYGVKGRIGYGVVNLVCYYGLNTVFEEGKAGAGDFNPQEFSIGLSINAK